MKAIGDGNPTKLQAKLERMAKQFVQESEHQQPTYKCPRCLDRGHGLYDKTDKHGQIIGTYSEACACAKGIAEDNSWADWAKYVKSQEKSFEDWVRKNRGTRNSLGPASPRVYGED